MRNTNSNLTQKFGLDSQCKHALAAFVFCQLAQYLQIAYYISLRCVDLMWTPLLVGQLLHLSGICQGLQLRMDTKHIHITNFEIGLCAPKHKHHSRLNNQHKRSMLIDLTSNLCKFGLLYCTAEIVCRAGSVHNKGHTLALGNHRCVLQIAC